jgi:hypothetical protein
MNFTAEGWSSATAKYLLPSSAWLSNMRNAVMENNLLTRGS